MIPPPYVRPDNTLYAPLRMENADETSISRTVWGHACRCFPRRSQLPPSHASGLWAADAALSSRGPVLRYGRTALVGSTQLSLWGLRAY
jgi:hypothetical protein